MKFKDLKLLFNFEMEKARKAAPVNTARFVTLAYKRVLKVIGTYWSDAEMVSAKKINELPITEHMKAKLLALSKKTLSKAIQKNKAEDALKLELANVLGIGAQKIKELMAEGLTSFSQLKQKKFLDMLSDDIKLMLLRKPLRKIPRAIIAKIEPKLTDVPYTVQVVGSYRRGMPYSKDVDVLLCGDKSVLDKYVTHLKKAFGNKVWVYSRGDDRVSLLVGVGAVVIKIDIFRTTSDTYYTQLLYSTGSKDFNIRMRGRARRLGMLLNQTGLYKGEKKINTKSDDEAAILALLGMRYVAPEKRV